MEEESTIDYAIRSFNESIESITIDNTNTDILDIDTLILIFNEANEIAVLDKNKFNTDYNKQMVIQIYLELSRLLTVDQLADITGKIPNIIRNNFELQNIPTHTGTSCKQIMDGLANADFNNIYQKIEQKIEDFTKQKNEKISEITDQIKKKAAENTKKAKIKNQSKGNRNNNKSNPVVQRSTVEELETQKTKAETELSDINNQLKNLEFNKECIPIFYCILEYKKLLEQSNTNATVDLTKNENTIPVATNTTPDPSTTAENANSSNIASSSSVSTLGNVPSSSSLEGGRRTRRTYRRRQTRRPTQTRRPRNTRRRRKNMRRRTMRRRKH